MENKQLIDELEQLPSKLKENELLVFSLTQEVNRLMQSRDILELKEKAKITEEATMDGKKLFSNETLREAELHKRKAMSESFLILEKTITERETQLALAKIELTYLYNQFKAFRTIAKINQTGGD